MKYNTGRYIKLLTLKSTDTYFIILDMVTFNYVFIKIY